MIAEEDQHLGRSVGAASEALPEGGRRFGRASREVAVVRCDFLGEGDPAAGERPKGVLGGRGGRVEGGCLRRSLLIGRLHLRDLGRKPRVPPRYT